MRILHFKLAAVACLALWAAAVAAKATDDVHAYRLAPGDRIKITVFGQAELSGDYTIDGLGMIQMPLLQSVSLGRATLEETRQMLTERLTQGFLKSPVVSVRISEFRPIYVLGAVRKPGTYPFQFGLSGMRAIALAGGTGYPELSPGTALADLLSAEERVKLLIHTRLGLLVRLARVEAERRGDNTLDVQEIANTVGNADVSTLLNEEKEQLSNLQKAHAETIALLEGQRPKVQSEIETIKNQISVETRQLDLIRSKLKAYASLEAQGFARTSTELDFHRQAADRESMISRLQGDLARLQSKLGDLDIRIHDAENSRQTRVIGELRDIKLKLTETEALLPSARRALELRRSQTSGGDEDSLESYRIALTRGGERQQLAVSAGGDVELEPGDILEVQRIRPDRQASEPSSTDACDSSFDCAKTTAAAALNTSATAVEKTPR